MFAHIIDESSQSSKTFSFVSTQDQKKLQGQLMAEHEAMYGSKPSPMKNQSAKKGRRMSCSGATNRRLSVGGTMLQTPKLSIGGTMPQTPKTEFHSTKATPNTHNTKKSDLFQFNYSNDDGLPALSSGNFLTILISLL